MDHTNQVRNESAQSDGEIEQRWGQARRLEFIDFRLQWERIFNRADLKTHFGISIPQATIDIGLYANLASTNLTYDRSSRTYRATEQFQPKFPQNGLADRYLNQLLACHTGLMNPEDSYIGRFPAMATVPLPPRAIESRTLSILLEAIHGNRCVRILYQSDSSDDPIARRISPHAFGYDRFRWHVRAYCYLREDYRDFALGRILQIEADPTPGRDPTLDFGWNEIVRVVIAPNPELTSANRKVIEIDYGMQDGVTAIDVRRALLYYALRDLRLGPFAASREQIVLLNNAELAPYIARFNLPDRRNG